MIPEHFYPNWRKLVDGQDLNQDEAYLAGVEDVFRAMRELRFHVDQLKAIALELGLDSHVRKDIGL